jgi:hypothetical protein
MSTGGCLRHGYQKGCPLACRHISGDLRSGSALRPYRQVKGDFLDDGSLVFELVLCTDCVERLGVGDLLSVGSRIFDAADPVPVCRLCFDEFSNRL